MLSDPKAARRFPGPQLNPSNITRGSFYTGKSRDTKVLYLPNHDTSIHFTYLSIVLAKKNVGIFT